MYIDIVTVIRHLPGAFMLFAASTLLAPAQERDRSKVADEYKWDLSALYPSDDAWRSEKQKLAADLPELRKFQGTLASSPARLADALEIHSRFEKEVGRLFSYAAMSSDQDTRVSHDLKLVIEQLESELADATEERDDFLEAHKSLRDHPESYAKFMTELTKPIDELHAKVRKARAILRAKEAAQN